MVDYGGSYIFSQHKGKKSEKRWLLEQIFALSSLVHVGDKKYKAETIIRAFEYFARSRTLYNRVREDYELPNISTLMRLTSKVNKINNTQLLKSVFCNVQERQKTFHKTLTIVTESQKLSGTE